MNAEADGSDEDLLIEYLREALESQQRGQPVDLRAICAGRPDLAGAVGEALGLGASIGALRVDPPARLLAGRYRLEAPLGRGAMGAVHEATDLELGRRVAVKLFDTIGPPKPEDDQRFAREAEALAALRHDHVVVVHDRGQDADGTLFVVMERLRGAPLSALQQQAAGREAEPLAGWLGDAVGGLEGPLPESTWLRAVVRWAADIAAGLAAAHACGIFHRDVKPSNIFVRRDLEAVLLDFGIAARVGDPALTGSGASLGTPWYMAPEQAAGAVRASASIDVYGLSATLYHLLTGTPPYAGDAMQVVARLAEADPRPPASLRPDLPRDLCAIVEKGMERDPRRRYPSAAALEADLRAFLVHRPVQARPLTRFGRLARRVRRAPARAAALAATVLALVLVAVVLPLWASAEARARDDERRELFAALPALLAIEGEPHQRLLQDLAERGRSLAVLDRMLELEPDDLPQRLWRAALRVDQGQHAAAAEDLREIVARAGDSAYVAEVARRYLAADPARLGTEAIDLDGLPEPATTFDRFVAGFHELRNRHRPGFADRAITALEPIAEEYPPARELRIITLLYLGELRRDAAAFRAAVRDSDWLAGFYGRETARTLALRGAALAALGQYEDAVRNLERSLELRPDRHGPLHNLGVALRRLGEHARAQDVLERAHALRPHFWNSTYMLGLLHKDRGDFVRALSLADALVDDLPAAHAWRAPELRATVLLRRAIAGREAGRPAEESRADAAQAGAAFEQAIALTTSAALREKLGQRRELAAFVAADQQAAAIRAMVELLAGTPDDPYEIANLAAILPDAGLGPDAIAAFRDWLRRLSIRLAEGDPAFQAGQQSRLAPAGGR